MESQELLWRNSGVRESFIKWTVSRLKPAAGGGGAAALPPQQADYLFFKHMHADMTCRTGAVSLTPPTFSSPPTESTYSWMTLCSPVQLPEWSAKGRLPTHFKTFYTSLRCSSFLFGQSFNRLKWILGEFPPPKSAGKCRSHCLKQVIVLFMFQRTS